MVTNEQSLLTTQRPNHDILKEKNTSHSFDQKKTFSLMFRHKKMEVLNFIKTN